MALRKRLSIVGVVTALGLLPSLGAGAQDGQDRAQFDNYLVANKCLPEVWDELNSLSHDARQQYVNARTLQEPRRVENVGCNLDILSDRLEGFINLPSPQDIMSAIQNGVCRTARRYVGEADRVLQDNLSFDVRVPGAQLPADINIRGGRLGTTMTNSPSSSPAPQRRESNNQSNKDYLDMLYGPKKKENDGGSE